VRDAPRCAFVFPGQDAPRPGMGLALASRSPLAAALLQRAGQVTGVDVHRLLERGGPALQATSVLQPVTIAVLLGIAGEFAQVRPALVAGHSLGEIAAWSAAGCISSMAAVDVAGTRGRLMEREARLHPGGLLALTGATEAIFNQALACGRSRGRLDLAARNSVHEWVVTGEEPALRAVAASFPSTRLAATGPWHSPIMADAVDELRTALTSIPCEPGHARFITNRTGFVVGEIDIPDLIAGQLVRPVAWLETLDTLAEAGVTDVVVMGPSKPHAVFARSRLGKNVRVWTTETDYEISSAQEALRS
jgi:[acyl-carrier-protein] S-malonyltransferase